MNKITRYINWNNKTEISHNLSDFNWENQAHGVLYRYAPEMAEALMLLLQEVAEKRNPDLVLADGQDATSALAGSLFAAEGPDEET